MVRGFGDTGGDIAARLNYCNENLLYDDLYLNIYIYMNFLAWIQMHQGTRNKGSFATLLHQVQ